MKYNDGFTLLELIVATFIGTMLIMASAYAIKTGLSSMEKEAAWFNDLSKER
ncbi:MAG: prepilin-type N-terminal cleavage/methylation domain-containing protein, partial [Planctomycetes bacterium]|nr:prepilin-type N-terminal cleavage/methylation domain-containing protein [Planctomycetota bacterium]